MAELTQKDVLKLASLAKLHLSDDEVERFQKEIEAILGYVAQLQKVPLANEEPTYQVTGLKNVMRPDEVYDYGASSQLLLENAPASEKGHIKVRRILE